jgi:tetratricopeptide (TPR) repeat protein
LQIWIEQGILGIAAFAWWLVAFYVWVWRRRENMNWLALAGVAAATLMLVHGVVDVLIYFSRVLPLMFIPFGLAVSALNDGPAPQPIAFSTRARILLAAAVAVVLAFIGLFVLTRRTELLAQWDANQGATRQAQIELPQYHFSDHILRIVRQSTDETPALTLFEQAVARDPNNRTANLRIGLIELDQQKFDAATQHLEAAYRADPTNRASTKALGYAYVWTGKLDQAAMLLRDIDEAPTELQTAAGVWQQSKKPQLAQNANMVIQKLKTQAQ